MWFDNSAVYRFFREKDKIEELKKKQRIGYFSPYEITSDCIRIEVRKKRIRLLASFMGYEYGQRLEYLHFTLERFLRASMPINRLSSLLNETFFYFERYLYMKVNWDEGKSSFYRDHSLHPAGEAFLGYELLKKNPELEEEFFCFLKNNTSITRYIFDNCRVGLIRENLKPIVYRTWFLASLFHDLGYVLSFYREHRTQMLSFQRYSDLIFRSSRSSFDDIQLLLSNSLLFNTVEHKVLEDCYNHNQHGTYSAFLLLATFYSPPAFENVDNIDRIAIELAARAIFFHDWPEEDKIDFLKNPGEKKGKSDNKKLNPNSASLGDYSTRFELLSDNDKNKLEIKGDLEKNGMKLNKIYRIDLEVKTECDGKGTKNQWKPKRDALEKDPFAYYLRFIDELQVFGRNSLVTSFPNAAKSREGKSLNPKESSCSYEMPYIRNLVPFPAQIIRYQKDSNTLVIYYIADDYLFSKNIDGKPNSLFNHNYEKEDKNWPKYFLQELFWLKQCVTDSKIFNDIKFYFIEALPGEENI